jgi:hypothetical protein
MLNADVVRPSPDTPEGSRTRDYTGDACGIATREVRMALSKFFLTPRTLRRATVVGLLAAVALATQALLGTAAHADEPPGIQRIVVPNHLNITTDRPEYYVGDHVQICFVLPAPGWYQIYDWQGGSPHLLKQGFNYDGHCFWGVATPPTGYEYLQLKYRDQYGQLQQAWSDVFYVYGGVPR